MNDYPVHIDLDLSSKCNIRCRFCHLSFFDPKEVAEFTLDSFLSLDNILKNLKSITLFSKYEPLTCKEFLPIFKKISSLNIESYFSTNGILLSEEIIESIVGKLTYLTISITGFSNESYKKNMGVDKFEIVKKNIKYINKLKKERNTKYPILRISTVGLLDSIDELKLAVDLVDKYNIEEGLQVTSFKAFSKEMVDLMPMKNPKYFTKVTQEAIKYASQRNVKFILQSGSIIENQQDTKELGHKKCNMPWYRLSIQPNGDVYPCPVALKPIGNFFKTNILDIWNSEEMKKFRNGVNSTENMNKDCLNCTHCRHRSVIDIQTNDFSDKNNYVAQMQRKQSLNNKLMNKLLKNDARAIMVCNYINLIQDMNLFDGKNSIINIGSFDLIENKNIDLALSMFKVLNLNLNNIDWLNNIEKNRINSKILWERLGFNNIAFIDPDGVHNAMKYDFNFDIQIEYKYKKTFDVVTNFGTAEHIFNQYLVFKNIHNLCNKNGLMIHSLPIQGALEHGLYNYQPNFFISLAKINNYHIKYIGIRHKDINNYALEELDDLSKLNNLMKTIDIKTTLGIFVIYEKTLNNTFQIPFQGRYESYK